MVANQWSKLGDCGLVVGATYPDELADRAEHRRRPADPRPRRRRPGRRRTRGRRSTARPRRARADGQLVTGGALRQRRRPTSPKRARRGRAHGRGAAPRARDGSHADRRERSARSPTTSAAERPSPSIRPSISTPRHPRARNCLDMRSTQSRRRHARRIERSPARCAAPRWSQRPPRRRVSLVLRARHRARIDPTPAAVECRSVGDGRVQRRHGCDGSPTIELRSRFPTACRRAARRPGTAGCVDISDGRRPARDVATACSTPIAGRAARSRPRRPLPHDRFPIGHTCEAMLTDETAVGAEEPEHLAPASLDLRRDVRGLAPDLGGT